MHDDDAPVGRLLTRREALALLGLTSAATLLGWRSSAGATTAQGKATSSVKGASSRPIPTCVVRPEQTEGPYFVEERLERSDIRLDPSDGLRVKGVPLQLAFAVSHVTSGGCKPLAGARVDVWHCDAAGLYSDVEDRHADTRGKKFLRGHQLTDANGIARFTTIYPGWYPGRTVHIHFKIRTDPAAERGRELISQLYFDDALSDKVFQRSPYSAKGRRHVRNRDDGIFRDGGDELMLAVTEKDAGYGASFDIGLDLS